MKLLFQMTFDVNPVKQFLPNLKFVTTPGEVIDDVVEAGAMLENPSPNALVHTLTTQALQYKTPGNMGPVGNYYPTGYGLFPDGFNFNFASGSEGYIKFLPPARTPL